ncbi:MULTISPECIES: glutamine--fructose-6-phosphate transaminase (isomerizing) [Methanosphaera]|mgnify:FL=1|uniref:Glutamine--fructose-6-phosphate aminotransferase [isomerizing] n=1 Tax=Methanosphaera stadtmanae (strain ATCC 43021 / DSM 3091 / JCM 11832 / MCB-3) TaxID=339860 RepID=Q2NF26_METST|nr:MULTISPECIES: glutamine--fructose-6-phosphate transaminase (isomerizing) [Methanosphaera]ABC57577.1 GlmS [Methanosphaera stadtmanae DSM 3091]MEE0489764.1 glutamine--fructose-6-phosphate transaminase (isomerizing) [Methanosphaera stadtmanae]OEC89098.1 glutamine--fructose-6-phosphate aminotransferase [Methanosphaera sp. A6]
MCGIVGCVLDKKAAPIIIDSIKKLEYRGYDSVGIATVTDSINVKKGSGKIKEVDDEIKLKDIDGNIGIAHVRWATHGNPTKENAHPHCDCKNKISIVHNGIIENYKELRQELLNEGHVFKSETDTEVIPHLIEKYMDEGLDLLKSVQKTVKRLIGSYALAVLSSDEPDRIIGARNESPLIVGVSDHGNYLASDVPAILNETKKVIYLEDKEIIVLKKDDVTIMDLDLNVLEKKITTITWDPEMAEKGGYEHFMIKEIYEEPQVIKDTLSEAEKIKEIVSKFKNFNRICFVACGTSYHASLIGEYLIESQIGIPTEVILASEFEYFQKTLDKHTLVIFITQSGETADTIKALKIAKKKSETLAIVNVVGSSITREADHVIYTRAGPEISVAATKTYISQLICIYLLVAYLGENEKLLDNLYKISRLSEKILSREEQIREIAKKYKFARDFFYIGRGFNYPTALEGALKLKEITYIHGEGYPAGELKHGPLALIEDNIPVVGILPPGPSYRKTYNNLQEIKARGADMIILGANNDTHLDDIEDKLLFDPEIDEVLSPLLYIIDLQLLAYYISIEKGIDPDKPKNLAKSVTVE